MMNANDLVRLADSARFHRENLKVTPEVYTTILRTMRDQEDLNIRMVGLPPPADPRLALGPRVEVVLDGDENVRLVDDRWVFEPSKAVEEDV